jgi:hypothetical protein
MRRMFSDAAYAPRPWPLHRLQTGVHVTHFWAVRIYDSQMRRDLDCVLGGGERSISVFESFQRSLLPCEVERCHNAKQLHLSAFPCVYWEMRGFQLFLKHSTIPCTIDRLSMTLVVLEDGPIKVTKERQHHFVGRRHTFEFLGPGWWRVFPLYALLFACMLIVVHTHVSSPMTICCSKVSSFFMI